MSTYRVDYKELVEKITSLKVYPVVIPQGAKYPCIEMSLSGGGRDGDSSLSESNIKGYRLSLVICSELVSTNESYETKLLAALDGKALTQGDTKSLIIRHTNTVEIYNYAQGLHEMTVEFTTKKIN